MLVPKGVAAVTLLFRKFLPVDHESASESFHLESPVALESEYH